MKKSWRDERQCVVSFDLLQGNTCHLSLTASAGIPAVNTSRPLASSLVSSPGGGERGREGERERGREGEDEREREREGGRKKEETRNVRSARGMSWARLMSLSSGTWPKSLQTSANVGLLFPSMDRLALRADKRTSSSTTLLRRRTSVETDPRLSLRGIALLLLLLILPSTVSSESSKTLLARGGHHEARSCSARLASRPHSPRSKFFASNKPAEYLQMSSKWKLPSSKAEWQSELDEFLDQALNDEQRNYVLFKLRAAAAAGRRGGAAAKSGRAKGAPRSRPPPVRTSSGALTPIRERGAATTASVPQRKASVFDALLMSSPKRAASSPGLRQSHRNSTVGFIKQAFGISSSPAMAEADTSDVFCVKTMLEAALARDEDAKYHLVVCVADEQHVLTTDSLTHRTTARELVAQLLAQREPPLEANHGLRLFTRNVIKSKVDPLARLVVTEEVDLDATVMDIAAGFDQALVDKGRAGFLIALDVSVDDPEFDCPAREMKAENLHFVYTQLRADVRAARCVADLATMIKLSAIAVAVEKGAYSSHGGLDYWSKDFQREMFGDTFDDRRWYQRETNLKLGDRIKAEHAAVTEQLGASGDSNELQRMYVDRLARAKVPYLAVWSAAKWKVKSADARASKSEFHEVQVGIDRSGIHIVDVVNKVSESFAYHEIASMGMSETSEIFLFTVGQRKNFLLSSDFERINEIVSTHIENIKRGLYTRRKPRVGKKVSSEAGKGVGAAASAAAEGTSPATAPGAGTAGKAASNTRRRRASRRRVSLTKLVADASSAKSKGSLAAAVEESESGAAANALKNLPPGWQRAEHEGRAYL